MPADFLQQRKRQLSDNENRKRPDGERGGRNGLRKQKAEGNRIGRETPQNRHRLKGKGMKIQEIRELENLVDTQLRIVAAIDLRKDTPLIVESEIKRLEVMTNALLVIKCKTITRKEYCQPCQDNHRKAGKRPGRPAPHSFTNMPCKP